MKYNFCNRKTTANVGGIRGTTKYLFCAICGMVINGEVVCLQPGTIEID